ERPAVSPAGGDVAVETVVGEVGGAVLEPLGERRIPLADLGGRGEPMQLARLVGPKTLGILDAAAVQLVVLPAAAHAGPLRERGGGLEHAGFLGNALDRG